jgi:hypothetical protein
LWKSFSNFFDKFGAHCIALAFIVEVGERNILVFAINLDTRPNYLATKGEETNGLRTGSQNIKLEYRGIKFRRQ